MAVTTIGTTGAVFGLTAETGMLVQTVTAKVAREKNQVRNEVGEFTVVAFYNPLQTFAISGVLTGTITNAAPGLALTVANTNTANGVSTGGIYVDDIEIAKTNTEFKKITANATQYPLIA